MGNYALVLLCKWSIDTGEKQIEIQTELLGTKANFASIVINVSEIHI